MTNLKRTAILFTTLALTHLLMACGNKYESGCKVELTKRQGSANVTDEAIKACAKGMEAFEKALSK